MMWEETELRKALSDLSTLLTLADHDGHIHNVAALVPAQSIYQLLYKYMHETKRRFFADNLHCNCLVKLADVSIKALLHADSN